MDNISPEIIEALKKLHQIMPPRWLLELPRVIERVQADTRYGAVEIIIADGRVVGVDITSKLR